MKSFADWTTDLAAANQKPDTKTYAGAMDWDGWIERGAVDWEEGEHIACCQGCGEWKPIECEAHQFDPAYHYCGGSPRCCP